MLQIWSVLSGKALDWKKMLMYICLTFCSFVCTKNKANWSTLRVETKIALWKYIVEYYYTSNIENREYIIVQAWKVRGNERRWVTGWAYYGAILQISRSSSVSSIMTTRHFLQLPFPFLPGLAPHLSSNLYTFCWLLAK